MRRSQGYRNPIRLKVKLKKKTLQTIAGLFLVGFAGLSILAMFGTGTGFAEVLRQKEFEFLGWGTILLPVAAVLLSSVLLRINLPFTGANTAFGFSIFLVCVTS